MGILKTVTIAILSLSAVVFCALFGRLPRFRKTPIGYANRLIWIKIPSMLIVVDNLITGGRSAVVLKRIGNYLMNENHPVVLIFYLLLLVCGQGALLPAIWTYLDALSRMFIVIVAGLPYAFTYLTIMTQTSVITSANHAEMMRHYPYDYMLYFPGNWCSTCRHLKPARSKHCRVCNVCIAKHDHHCLWVMTCLGKHNYHYFMAMLAALGFMLSYGAYVCFKILYWHLQEQFEEENPAHSDLYWPVGLNWSEYFNAFAWSFVWDIRIGSVGLLAAFTAPLAWGLFLYHIYLIWAGATTNESFKWDDWNADVRDGYVYIAREPRDVTESEVAPYVRWPKRNDVKVVNRAIRVSVDNAGQGLRLAEPEWKRVEGREELDNLYDLGFWENLKDVLEG